MTFKTPSKQQHIDYYEVGNNTDMQGAPLRFEAQEQERADRAWLKIAPRAAAGNRYHAFYRGHCRTCDSWQDARPDVLGVTCECHQ